jgi:hypothetical protein
MNILAAAMIMLVSILPTSAGSKHQPPIAYDDERQLAVQMRVIDIAVLANDIGPGSDNLYLVTVNGTRGGRAEIIDGRIVRVTIDWASYAAWANKNRSGVGDRVAYGTYIISNGYARSAATWTIRYWPEMNT